MHRHWLLIACAAGARQALHKPAALYVRPHAFTEALAARLRGLEA